MADAPDENRWGTIFMGPTSDRESSIDKVTEVRQRELWNRRTEAEYMERVRIKATVRVQAMLDQARAQAEAIRGTARQWAEKVKNECEDLHAQAERARQDAEALRAEAGDSREASRQEGYTIGAEQALLELEEHRTALDDATASVLKAIESQCDAIFAAWRQDLADLTRESVETATGWILTEERQAILAALLPAAVQALSERRRLVVRVNPQDCEAVTLVIESAKARFPEVQGWQVRPDETVSSGGLLVESLFGMVDNRVEIRREVVVDVLRHLSLPPGPADEHALAAVAEAMERSGMNALAAESDARAAELEAMQAQEAEEAARQLELETLAGPQGLPEQAKQTEQAEQTEKEALAEAAATAEAGVGSTAPQAEAMPGSLPDDFDFPELRGIELPPDLPPDLAELLQAQGPTETAELPPAAPDVDMDGAAGPDDAAPTAGDETAAPANAPANAQAKPSEANLPVDENPEDDDIPVLNITIGEPDAATQKAAAEVQSLEDSEEAARHGA